MSNNVSRLGTQQRAAAFEARVDDWACAPASQLRIAGLPLRNRVLLAPMSGVTDEPFRDLAHAWNAGLTVTEMVASRELARERPQVQRRARAGSRPGAMPHVVQLAGCEPHWMAEGARIAESLGADTPVSSSATRAVRSSRATSFSRKPKLRPRSSCSMRK